MNMQQKKSAVVEVLNKTNDNALMKKYLIALP